MKEEQGDLNGASLIEVEDGVDQAPCLINEKASWKWWGRHIEELATKQDGVEHSWRCQHQIKERRSGRVVKKGKDLEQIGILTEGPP